MTVVTPSATCTCVSARCVLIDGLPLTARLKSGVPFSSTMRMMTVLAPVICGVTVQLQRGVLELHGHRVVRDGLNRNLEALRDFGLLVVLRRHARRATES